MTVSALHIVQEAAWLHARLIENSKDISQQLDYSSIYIYTFLYNRMKRGEFSLCCFVAWA